MKKMIASAASVLMLAAAVPMAVQAEEDGAFVGESIHYDYEVGEDGNVSLYDFLDGDSFEGDLVIPSEIDGHPVTYIGNGCFMSDTGITSITIPKTITDLGSSVFFDCESLTEFRVEDGNPYFSVKDGVLLGDEEKYFVAYPAAKEGTSYTIPDTVEEIAPGAFGFAQHLEEIVIPDNVQYIDNWAFGHSKIRKADISGSVIQIDSYAFAYCDELSEVNLGSGLEKILHASFAYDEKLTQITLPDTLTYVGQYAFCGAGLSCITIPNSVEEISYCAFGYDGDMKAIHDFVIYGEPYTTAQIYATTEDDENDYKNNFTFIAVEDASIPYELGGGKLYVEEEESTPEEESAEESIVETDENGNPVRMDDRIGAGLFGNKRLQLFLSIGGGIAILLAVVLLIAFLRKPAESEKEQEKKTDDADNSDASEDSAESDETADNPDGSDQSDAPGDAAEETAPAPDEDSEV